MFYPEISGKIGMIKSKREDSVSIQSANGNIFSAPGSKFYGDVHVGDINNSVPVNYIEPEIEMRIGGTELKIKNTDLCSW
jgi:hypothetical protein